MTDNMKVTMTDPRTHDYFYDEASKNLRTNIRFSGANIKTIVITSSYPNEGKSDIVFQLAMEIGNMGKRVLLIDADIRKSSYVSRYKIGREIHGLSEYLSGQCGIKNIVYSTNFTGVDIIFAGPSAPNPSELLEQEEFGKLLLAARERYDYVLIDTPPVISMTDAAIVARYCDGAILVIEKERVSRRMAIKAKEQLAASGCRILGGVLNKVDIKSDRYYSRYSNYKSYYGYDHDKKKGR